ncbi:MAG TPA: ATP-binding cassette domain-containing protein [Candidatus Polarisedimenticolia bacterium]|nr:ATP-binding cassette domain-containing protein [Candidatus Polarisedimenticolia bacterium]
MSATLSFHLDVPMGRFPLSCAWSTGETALGLFGPSGAGKTTLLETLAGLRANARGRIEAMGELWLDTAAGVDRPSRLRGVGYVPQDQLLFPHRDVMGNVMAGRRRASGAGRPLQPGAVLELLELGPLRGRAVGSLSGGERQRVALGRALCSGARLLLLDEPLAGLDLPLRRRTLSLLLRVREELGVPTLHVSHEPSEVRLLCRDVLVLEQGRRVAAGSPEHLFADPAVVPMAARDGYDNVLRGTARRSGRAAVEVGLAGGATITVAGVGVPEGRSVAVAVKAEDLILAAEPPRALSAQNVLAARITEVRPAGGQEQDPEGQVRVMLELAGGGEGSLMATVTPAARAELGLEAGAAVHVVCKANACRILAVW